MFANLANLHTASMKDIYLHARNFIHDDPYTGSIAATAWTGIGTWATMKNIEHVKKILDEYITKTKLMHGELIDVATTVNTTQNVMKHLNATDAAPKHDVSILTSTYSQSSDAALNQLLDNLASSTFSKSKNMYSRGRVLATHRILTEEKEKLAPLLEVIGLIDAYVSLAEVYMEQKNTQAPYCFADITERDTPYINVSDCWCPLISPAKAVPNALQLGSTGHNTNAILTGPNALGKTLFMQGISHAVMLAQSVGMAPAASAEISLFHCIKSYLNITQDPTQGLSSFAAEKARVEELKDYMKNHTHAGPYLFVLDEPYSKTYAREAEIRVYDFGKTIAEHPNCMALLATHLEKPTNLEEDTAGIFKNYHPEVIENDDGTFTPCFKIKPGRPAWWFSDDQKRSKFVDWLATPS
jgi:DNA mismatch repair protein MutS